MTLIALIKSSPRNGKTVLCYQPETSYQLLGREISFIVFPSGHERELHSVCRVFKMEKIWSNSKSIKWDESNILGQGCQGTVVFSGHFDGQPVAVKRILLTNTQLVKRELNALVECSGHQHILQLYHVEHDAQFL